MPRTESAFTTIPIDRGVTLHHRRSDRFKTELVRVFFRAPLDDRRTERHLFAALLGRGTGSTPTRRDLAARMQDLYGAGYGASVQRLSGRHVLGLRASTVSGRWLPGRPKNLRSLLQFLSEALQGPPIGPDGLPIEDVFEQERRTLLRDLQSRITNKSRYAMDRLRQEMFKGQVFADPDIGRAEDIQGAERAACLAEGMRVLSEGEADIYLLAPCTPLQAEKLIRKHLALAPRRRERLMRPPLAAPRRRPRRVTEALDIEQGKLALGFRVEDWEPGESHRESLLADVILGGGPTSKLFRNVREARSLCYDVRSTLDRNLGVWTVTAGIKPAMCDEALTAIRAEIRAMKAGHITAEEVDTARRAILSGLRAVPDSQSSLVEFFFRRRLTKRREKTVEAVARSYARASVTAIPDLMARLRLDTVFFLDSVGQVEATVGA